MIRTRNLTWKSESLALENEIYEFWRKFWQIPTCSQRSVCDGLEGLYAVQAAFIPMQIWRHDP